MRLKPAAIKTLHTYVWQCWTPLQNPSQKKKPRKHVVYSAVVGLDHGQRFVRRDPRRRRGRRLRYARVGGSDVGLSCTQKTNKKKRGESSASLRKVVGVTTTCPRRRKRHN